jgi:hypothetical protein
VCSIWGGADYDVRSMGANTVADANLEAFDDEAVLGGTVLRETTEPAGTCMEYCEDEDCVLYLDCDDDVLQAPVHPSCTSRENVQNQVNREKNTCFLLIPVPRKL